MSTEAGTHAVTVTVHGKYPHGEQQHASVMVVGDGGLGHMVETFRAALVAAGFDAETAAKLECDFDR